MIEKRRHARVDLKLPVTLRYDGRLIPATMLNISCGGMCIRADDANITKSGPIEITFDLDEKQKDVSMRGEVIRTETQNDSTNIGIQFTNLFSLSFKAIQEYLGKNLN